MSWTLAAQYVCTSRSVLSAASVETGEETNGVMTVGMDHIVLMRRTVSLSILSLSVSLSL